MHNFYEWNRKKRKKNPEKKGQIGFQVLCQKRLGKPLDPKKQPVGSDLEMRIRMEAESE